jgi:hypothetical protein
MSLILVSAAILLVSTLVAAALLAWLAARIYALDVFWTYQPGRLRMGIELISPSRLLLAAFLRIEERDWHAGLQTRKRALWQHSWKYTEDFDWRRMLGQSWELWNHPARPAWVEAIWRLLQEIYALLRLREVRLILRLGLSTYPRTGYLAASAYPLNYTLLRIPRVWQARVYPDFSGPGFTLENRIRCTFQGWQVVKPGYRFLSRTVVRDLLKKRTARRFPRLARFFRHRAGT